MSSENATIQIYRKTMAIKQGLLPVAVAGSGDPLLLVPSLPAQGFAWRKLQLLLANEYQTIAPDFMLSTGSPASSPPDDKKGDSGRLESFLNPIEILHETLAEVGDQQISLIAHGFGGGIAQLFAEKYPDRVRSLILINAPSLPGYGLSGTLKMLQLPLLGELIQNLPTALLRFLFRRHLLRGFHQRVQFTAPIFNEYFKIIQTAGRRNQLLKFLRNFAASDLERALSRNCERRVPMLLLWGEKDNFQPPESGNQLFERVNSGKFIRIAEGGHFLMEEQPERIHREINRFFSELPP